MTRMRQIDDMVLHMNGYASRPKPMEVAIEEMVDFMEIQHWQMDPARFSDFMKRRMTAKLAAFIMEHCKVFSPPGMDSIRPGKPIRMQLTINDRGAYENWIPTAEESGFRDGFNNARKSAPYGFLEVDYDL